MNRRWKMVQQQYAQPGGGKPGVAAALRYDPEVDAAPVVVASGEGKTAERILELARENQIPICDDPVLAAMLSQVNVGEEIPEALYQVVAEILAYIYRVAYPLPGPTPSSPVPSQPGGASSASSSAPSPDTSSHLPV
jgi:flagellar biosynthesis protein